jgi:AcrR family transcriptional regulator
MSQPGDSKALKAQRIRRSPEEARAEILAAAQAALAETGLATLTVDQVMRRTGMTRSSFYHYFKDLDELGVGLLEQFAQEIRDSVDPWLRGELDEEPISATVHHLTAMFEVMHAHRAGVRAVAQAAGGFPAVYQRWQTRVIDYFIDLTADFIRREFARGRSRVDEPERMARALILMNNAVANDNMLRDQPDAPAAVARVLAGIWNASIYGRAAP